jgi:hypothetical protein
MIEWRMENPDSACSYHREEVFDPPADGIHGSSGFRVVAFWTNVKVEE